MSDFEKMLRLFDSNNDYEAFNKWFVNDGNYTFVLPILASFQRVDSSSGFHKYLYSDSFVPTEELFDCIYNILTSKIDGYYLEDIKFFNGFFSRIISSLDLSILKESFPCLKNLKDKGYYGSGFSTSTFSSSIFINKNLTRDFLFENLSEILSFAGKEKSPPLFFLKNDSYSEEDLRLLEKKGLDIISPLIRNPQYIEIIGGYEKKHRFWNHKISYQFVRKHMRDFRKYFINDNYSSFNAFIFKDPKRSFEKIFEEEKKVFYVNFFCDSFSYSKFKDCDEDFLEEIGLHSMFLSNYQSYPNRFYERFKNKTCKYNKDIISMHELKSF